MHKCCCVYINGTDGWISLPRDSNGVCKFNINDWNDDEIVFIKILKLYSPDFAWKTYADVDVSTV